MRNELVQKQLRRDFENWIVDTWGYHPARSTKPGQTDDYESTFVQGAWAAWKMFTNYDGKKPKV